MLTRVLGEVVAAAILLAVCVAAQNSSSVCKEPTVVHRLLSDDVRYASPFYVIALPRTPKTEQVDNVCYTYFDTGDDTFFHVASVVFINGSNQVLTFSKSDISNRMGLAEAKAEKMSSCRYHDYTLTPICNVTVFVLYRCFIDGDCSDIDIGITPGVDVRVVLAATPHITDICRKETEENLKDTSSLDGGDYVVLPQSRKPQCVTKYGNRVSLNPHLAVGKIELSDDDVANRFAEDNEDLEFTGTTTTASAQSSSSESSSGNQAGPLTQSALPVELSAFPKKTYADAVKSSVPTKSAVKNKFKCMPRS